MTVFSAEVTPQTDTVTPHRPTAADTKCQHTQECCRETHKGPGVTQDYKEIHPLGTVSLLPDEQPKWLFTQQLGNKVVLGNKSTVKFSSSTRDKQEMLCQMPHKNQSWLGEDSLLCCEHDSLLEARQLIKHFLNSRGITAMQ